VSITSDGTFRLDWGVPHIPARCYYFHGSPQDLKASYSTAPAVVTTTARVLD